MNIEQFKTTDSFKRFMAYARDAGNWSGFPCVGGNVGGDAEDTGYLTNMKKAGLIKTQVDGGMAWITFTDAGMKLAMETDPKIKAWELGGEW